MISMLHDEAAFSVKACIGLSHIHCRNITNLNIQYNPINSNPRQLEPNYHPTWYLFACKLTSLTQASTNSNLIYISLDGLIELAGLYVHTKHK